MAFSRYVAPQYERDDRRNSNHHKNRAGTRAQIVLSKVLEGAHLNRIRISATDPLGYTAPCEQATERNNKGWNAGISRQPSLQRTDHKAYYQGCQQGWEQSPMHKDLHQDSSHTRESNERSDREIDLARDDHHDHPDGQQAGDCRLANQIGKVARLEEDAIGEQSEDDPQQYERQYHAVAANGTALQVQTPDFTSGRSRLKLWLRQFGFDRTVHFFLRPMPMLDDR